MEDSWGHPWGVARPGSAGCPRAPLSPGSTGGSAGSRTVGSVHRSRLRVPVAVSPAPLVPAQSPRSRAGAAGLGVPALSRHAGAVPAAVPGPGHRCLCPRSLPLCPSRGRRGRGGCWWPAHAKWLLPAAAMSHSTARAPHSPLLSQGLTPCVSTGHLCPGHPLLLHPQDLPNLFSSNFSVFPRRVSCPCSLCILNLLPPNAKQDPSSSPQGPFPGRLHPPLLSWQFVRPARALLHVLGLGQMPWRRRSFLQTSQALH